MAADDMRAVVRTGNHFIDGNEACAEGAIVAGCRFASGYPITPSTEIVERLAARFPFIGGMFLQMEDELAASICFQGAVWAGVKGMTVTSGPGFSLMMEHLGLAVMTELPCVIVDVQRAGPSTGLPTAPAQGDMMQARFGSHGDYEIIALSPSTPQECFDLTITAFNLSETYRCPVLLMMDESVGHMHGKVVIPPEDQITVTPRRFTQRPPGAFQPFAADDTGVPEMVATGMGHRIHVTGLTHDERGYPDMRAQAHESLVHRLCDKINNNKKHICIARTRHLDDAKVAVIGYGISARIAQFAVETGRTAKHLPMGMVQLVTVWPVDDALIGRVADQVDHIVVVEMNMGQMAREIERIAAGRAQVHHVGSPGGHVPSPETIIAMAQQVLS